jgi:ABC-type cobalamin/Fe3+-siderophores transport system ATPase subunit
MANTINQIEPEDGPPSRLRITRFAISGLFGGFPISIDFPDPQASAGPAIVILSGSNGIGKTTILRMIGGMLQLDFDEFRRVPFQNAELALSDGTILTVSWIEGSQRPLFVQYEELSMGLLLDKDLGYSPEERSSIDNFRAYALPRVRGIRYDLLELDRSNKQKAFSETGLIRDERGTIRRRETSDSTLSHMVRNFLREAQVNHRRFFRSEELDVLPRLIDRLSQNIEAPDANELLRRVDIIRAKIPSYERLGLYVDDEQLLSVVELIASDREWTPQQLSLIETYVEMQEAIQQARDLIATRLIEFERIMESFLVGKTIAIDKRHGLTINSRGKSLDETQLSSGEYHFLYMMVTALLCQRVGTIIAIDEPELSLHISWQRKIIRALSRCAAGASPLFLFATHSVAISAEHPDSVIRLSPVE